MIKLTCTYCVWEIKSDSVAEAVSADKAHKCAGRQAQFNQEVHEALVDLPHRYGMTTDELESYERGEQMWRRK